jgi:hypothetical protein
VTAPSTISVQRDSDDAVALTAVGSNRPDAEIVELHFNRLIGGADPGTQTLVVNGLGHHGPVQQESEMHSLQPFCEAPHLESVVGIYIDYSLGQLIIGTFRSLLDDSHIIGTDRKGVTFGCIISAEHTVRSVLAATNDARIDFYADIRGRCKVQVADLSRRTSFTQTSLPILDIEAVRAILV